jgi:hypothetical protein
MDGVWEITGSVALIFFAGPTDNFGMLTIPDSRFALGC